MLSLSSIRRPGYFTEIATADYYTEGGERLGEWLVSSGNHAQFNGTIDPTELENIMGGWSRDKSRRLTQSHPRRQKGWDLTFSAPKSVSVLYALAPKSIRELILKAHREAVATSLKYAVREALWTRRGKEGAKFERVEKAFFALFTHISSRSADPNLHDHCLLANACQRTDGTTGSLWSRDVYKHKMAAGAIYRTELAYLLQKYLGVTIRLVRDWFEIKGIPQNVCDHFSQRSQEIRRIARKYGVKHPRFLELITKVTSGIKGHLTHADLHRKWKQEAKRLRLTAPHLTELMGRVWKNISEKRANRLAANAAFQAIDSLSERHSYFTERQILVEAAPHLIGRGRGADLLFKAVEIAKRQLVLLESPQERYEHFTTLSLYNTEKRIMRMVTQYGKTRGVKAIPFMKLLPLLDKAFHRYWGKQTPANKTSIKKAVRHLACSSDNIRIISGEQGAGKTEALRLTKLAFERAGYDVVACAPTSAAAKDLRRHLGGDVVTVASLLDSANPSYGRRIRHVTRKAWRQVRGKKTRRYKEKMLLVDEKIGHYLKQFGRLLKGKFPRFSGQIKLTKKTVILVDEAQKLSTQDAHDLINAAKKANSPLRFAYTLNAPAAGGAGGAIFKMADDLGVYTMKGSVHDNQERWQKEAHKALREGNPKIFFSQYEKEGALGIASSQRKAIDMLVRSWFNDKAPVKEKLVIASQSDEVKKLNQAIQKRRNKKLLGMLGYAKVASGEKVRTGDRVRFTKANRSLGTDTNDMGTILKLTQSAKTPWRTKILIRLDGKKCFGILPKIVEVNTKHFKHLALGYACLPNEAHATITKAFVLLDSKTNRESLLHQVTRARKKTKLFMVSSDFAPTIDLYLDSLSKQQEKILAHQFEEQQRKSMGQSFSQTA